MKDLLGDILHLDASPSYQLYRIARLLRLDLRRLFQSLETVITPEQWILLIRLNEQDGQSQVELSDKFFKDPPSITRMVDALVKQRFVVRVPDARDRRRFLIYLTHDGKNFIEKAQSLVLEKRRHVFREFSSSDIEKFISYLNLIENSVLDQERHKAMTPVSSDASL